MKTIQLFVHWLCASKTKAKAPDRSALENVEDTTTPTLLKTKPVAFADDDSPPGFKIRWHF